MYLLIRTTAKDLASVRLFSEFIPAHAAYVQEKETGALEEFTESPDELPGTVAVAGDPTHRGLVQCVQLIELDPEDC